MNKIDAILSDYQSKPNGSFFINSLARELRKDGSAKQVVLANKLIEEQHVFKGLKTYARNKQYRKSIKDLLTTMEGTGYNRNLNGLQYQRLYLHSEQYEHDYLSLRESLLRRPYRKIRSMTSCRIL